jgi:Na+-driven multidrug efflux pump
MALQEVVLALAGDEDNQQRLAFFALAAGVVFSGLLAVLAFTPLAHVYFRALLRTPTRVENLAIPVTRILAPMPLLFGGRNLLRGLLIGERRSGSVQLAMSVNLLSLIVFLALGIHFGRLAGALLAAWATLGAHLLEVVSLRWLRRRVAHSGVGPTAIKAARGT